jgi:hypothetical protein
MLTREEAIKLAHRLVDRKSDTHVADGIALAHFIVRDEEDRKQLVDNLTACQQRCTELLEERRCLARAIEKIAAADPDGRDERIAEALVAARGAQ